MKTKYATVTLTKNANSFDLVQCRAQKTSEGLKVVKILDRIKIGNSSKELQEDAVRAGFTLVNPANEKSQFFFRGTKMPSGKILDPVRNWEGGLIRTVWRGEESLIAN